MSSAPRRHSVVWPCLLTLGLSPPPALFLPREPGVSIRGTRDESSVAPEPPVGSRTPKVSDRMLHPARPLDRAHWRSAFRSSVSESASESVSGSVSVSASVSESGSGSESDSDSATDADPRRSKHGPVSPVLSFDRERLSGAGPHDDGETRTSRCSILKSAEIT